MMKAISSKEAALKAKELSWFKTSQALCSVFPSGEPEQPPSPAPDIRFQHLNLGIEITEYLQKEEGGSKRRKLETLRDQIVDDARQEFETRSDARLMASVFWTPDRTPPAEVRDSLVEGIASVVHNLLAQGRGWRNLWRPDWAKSSDRILGQYIGEISITPEHGSSHWHCNDAGAVGGDVERVQATISGKESRVARYRSVCGNVWLLIVAENRISSYFSPDEDFEGAIFRTSFDRVFLFDVFRNQVRELTIRPI